MKWLLVAVATVLLMPAAYRVFGPEPPPPWSAVVETSVKFPAGDGQCRGAVFTTDGPDVEAKPAVVIVRDAAGAGPSRAEAGRLVRRGYIVLVVPDASPAVSAGAKAYLASRGDVDATRISVGGPPAPE